MKNQKQTKIKRRRVTFSHHAPDAGNVSLVGEFNNWNPKKHPMKCGENGVWTKTVVLKPGVYEYKFLADEIWMLDTENDHFRPNTYGTMNSLITVSPLKK